MLAVDVSGSVDEIEARLQREGYIAALRHPDVIEAIQRGMVGRIAVTYVEWAGDDYQRTMLDWTVIEDAARRRGVRRRARRGAAGDARTGPRSAPRSTTRCRCSRTTASRAVRRVIDISGDGYNNRGRPVEAARDEAVATGITINGLPIVNDRPNPWGGPAADLDRYFEEQVIGGPGAFLMVAKDYTAFASAILSKLLLEIAGERRRPPLAASALILSLLRCGLRRSAGLMHMLDHRTAAR